MDSVEFSEIVTLLPQLLYSVGRFVKKSKE